MSIGGNDIYKNKLVKILKLKIKSLKPSKEKS